MGIVRSVVAWLLLVLGFAAVPASDALGAPVLQGPDPIVAKWPHWPYPTTCGGPAFDPIGAFSGPTEAETGPGPAEEELRKTIGEWQTGFPTLPKHHWRLLSQEPSVVVYGHGRLPGVEELTLEESNGLWDFAGYSSRCEPASIIDGRQAITWTLSSRQSPLRPGTRQLWIDLGPGECASGMSQNARAMKPVFFELGKRLLMVMRLKPLPPGNYTCEGIFEPPLRVTLPKRLGTFTLFDGGVYPPSRAVLPRHR